MYQQSRNMLVFLIAVFLAITIACGAIHGMLECNHFSYGTLSLWMTNSSASQAYGIPEESVLAGTYQCVANNVGNDQLLLSTTWIMGSLWELFALYCNLDYRQALPQLFC
jgi:hypothetical protein